MFKTSLFVMPIVAMLAMLTVQPANAQFSYSFSSSSIYSGNLYGSSSDDDIVSSSSLYSSYDFLSYHYGVVPEPQDEGPIQFDSTTGVLEIDGSSMDDTVSIYLSSSDLRVYVDTVGSDSTKKSFKPMQINHIVFHGHEGDDVFMINGLEWMEAGCHAFTCDLSGGDGLDYLAGGIYDDILDGGGDGQQDYLEGDLGADEFVHHKIVSYFWVTYEYEYLADFNKYEGDLYRVAE